MSRRSPRERPVGIAAVRTQADLDRLEQDKQNAFEAIEQLKMAARQIDRLNGPECWDRGIARSCLEACLALSRDVLDKEEQSGEITIVDASIVSTVLGDLIAHLDELSAGRSDKRLRPERGGASRTHDNNDANFKLSARAFVNALSTKYREEGHNDYRARARRDVAREFAEMGIRFHEKDISTTLLESWEKRRNDRR